MVCKYLVEWSKTHYSKRRQQTMSEKTVQLNEEVSNRPGQGAGSGQCEWDVERAIGDRGWKAYPGSPVRVQRAAPRLQKWSLQTEPQYNLQRHGVEDAKDQGITFETAIVERYSWRESSAEKALIKCIWHEYRYAWWKTSPKLYGLTGDSQRAKQEGLCEHRRVEKSSFTGWMLSICLWRWNLPLPELWRKV